MRSGDCAYLFTARLMLASRARCARPSLLKRSKTLMGSVRAQSRRGPARAPREKEWPAPAGRWEDDSGQRRVYPPHQRVEADRLAQALEIDVGRGRRGDAD